MKKTFYICLIFLLAIFGYPLGYYVLTPNADLSAIVSSEHHENVSGIGAYVINLDRSKERYEFIKDRVAALGFKVERISAVDGKKLTEQEVNEKVDLKAYRLFMGHSPRLGIIGCNLSHMKAWQKFLESGFEYAIIFEDDVSFDPEKFHIAIDYLVKNDKLWDLANFEILHDGFPLTIKNYSDNQKLAVYLMEVTHIGTYMINRKAAQSMFEKSLPIKMPVDHYVSRSWEFDIKYIGIENPRLADQTFGTSDINAIGFVQSKKINALTSLQRKIFKLQSYVIRFLYNLKVYVNLKLAMR